MNNDSFMRLVEYKNNLFPITYAQSIAAGAFEWLMELHSQKNQETFLE